MATCKVQQDAAQFILFGGTAADDDDDEEEDEEDDDDWLNDMQQRERKVRATLVVMIGAAALNAFVQQNWTGPPLEAGGLQQWVRGN